MKSKLVLAFVLVALGLNFFIAPTDSSKKVAEIIPVDPLSLSKSV